MNLDIKKIRDKALELRAIDHSLRQKIIYLLDSNMMNVDDIKNHLGVDQAVVSQHLAILRKEGFVKNDKVGKFRIYSLTDKINDYAC